MVKISAVYINSLWMFGHVSIQLAFGFLSVCDFRHIPKAKKTIQYIFGMFYRFIKKMNEKIHISFY